MSEGTRYLQKPGTVAYRSSEYHLYGLPFDIGATLDIRVISGQLNTGIFFA
jgi:hypothetical protein